MDREDTIQPKRVAVYIRVSTEEQVLKYGPDLQREAVMALIKSRERSEYPFIFAGEEHVYFDNGIQGVTELEDRPQFARLMEAIRFAPEGAKPFDAVAVYRIDRFARKLKILLDVIDFFDAHQIEMLSVNESIDTSSPFGRAILGIIGVIAELERDTIKERTFAGRVAALRKGVHMGTSAKFGYLKDEMKRLQVCPEEADTVKLIFDLYVTQKLSVYGIAEYLTKNKYLTPEASAIKHQKHKGKAKAIQINKWHPENLRKMLADEIYTGRAFYGRSKAGKKVPKSEWIEYPAPQIIDDLTFEKAQRIAEESKHVKKEAPARHMYLLGGLLTCDTCKTNNTRKHFVGTPKPLPNNKRVYYYVCKGKSNALYSHTCSTLPLPADAVEEYVVSLCKKLLANPIHTFKYQQSLESTRLEIKHLKREEAQTRKLLDGLPQRRELLLYQHREGFIDSRRLTEQMNELKGQEAEHKKQLEEILHGLSQNTLNESYIKTFELFEKKYHEVLDDIHKNREKTRTLLHLLIDRIIVYSRPVVAEDKVAGKKKEGQTIPNRIHIKFRLPQDLLAEIGPKDIEKAPLGGASSSQKSDASGR